MKGLMVDMAACSGSTAERTAKLPLAQCVVGFTVNELSLFVETNNGKSKQLNAALRVYLWAAFETLVGYELKRVRFLD